MWATVLVLGLLVVSATTYWWLGRIWPETRELQEQMREERRRMRDILLRRTERWPERYPSDRSPN
ncbi:MAG TPA: hypothetical protein VKV34_08050 [Thermoleophilia bacterium]|nr:hypothetical protein [Thermoleophilia bacterium]